MRPPVLASLLAVFALAACSDRTTSSLSSPTAPDLVAGDAGGSEGGGSEGVGVFQRYVAVGTSISMGVQSDGVYAATQETSWPAQLARLAHRELTLPLISAPGCASPIVAPLASGVRLSGEPIGIPFLSRSCAPNEHGVTLPAGNVAIDGARTGQALTATPENPDPGHATQYPRVLPPGMSQITAMESQHPKVVSVELGANDVLGATSGVYIPGISVVPVSVWEPQYREIAARVDAVAKHAVLVGLVNDVARFPSFRAGNEIWVARASFAPFNVVVSNDCAESHNLVFVASRVPTAAATGAFFARNGLGAFTFSCANGGPGDPDGVLSPADVVLVNAQLAAMNDVIKEEAHARGFAYFALGALYEDVVTKAPFNAITLMTSPQPYGPYISLDGLHPTAEGARVIADAAARALNAAYRLGIPTSTGAAALFAAH
jgi:lysophospholipase L1-like esterase